MASNLLRWAIVKSWMLEYYLKRMPTPETVRGSWLFAVFGPSLMRLEYWVPSRHSLALGIGLGWCIGLLPVFGFHATLGLLAGVLFRCHLPSLVFGTFLANPFTLPGILAIEYIAGRWLCSLPGSGLAATIAALPPLPRFLVPLLAGGCACALLAGVLGYAGVRIYLACRGRKLLGWVV